MVLPLPTSQIFFTISAAPFFYRHPSVQNTLLSHPSVQNTLLSHPSVQNTLLSHPNVQNTLLSHKVKWSALFLLPRSNNMEQTPHFYPSRILCQFLQIFPENLSLFENLFFSPLALRCLCVKVCVCVWMCVCVCEYGCISLLFVYLNF